MPTSNMQIESKNLMILEDQMNHEYLSYKKAEQCARTFSDTALRGVAQTLASRHMARFDRLYQYLNSHN